MSHAATNWAVRQFGLKPAAKVILWHLADCHNASDGRCFPSQDYLAKASEMARSTVNLHLDVLEKRGLISRVSEVDPRTKRQLPTQYVLHLDAGTTESEYRTRTQDLGRGAQDVVPAVSENETRAVSEKQPEPCPKNDESRVRISDTNPVREPGKEPEEKRARKRAPETEIPPEWIPNDRNVADAAARGFSQQETFDEADRFRDYHLARGTRFRDWDAGWRTWLGNVRRFGNRAVAGRSFSGGSGQGGSLASIAARRRASGAV